MGGGLHGCKEYFKGAAVEDSILIKNMDELVNYKLTYIQPQMVQRDTTTNSTIL